MDYKNFHSLVEIAVKLDKYIEKESKIATSDNKKNRKTWHRNLKRWLKENYENNGITGRI